MMYYCQALVVAPGGVGTMDELFEVLTLKQTGKVQADLPVVLLGAVYWRTIINWEVWPLPLSLSVSLSLDLCLSPQAIVSYGVVARKDYEDLFFTDDIEEAFAYITARLTTNPKFVIPEADVATFVG
jgi:hypothetical protein